jgi:hypothetical protein
MASLLFVARFWFQARLAMFITSLARVWRTAFEPTLKRAFIRRSGSQFDEKANGA